jgi:hypothetical protein
MQAIQNILSRLFLGRAGSRRSTFVSGREDYRLARKLAWKQTKFLP